MWAFGWAIAILLVKVFFSILWEYSRYFPADFESNFLSGRRYTFTGIYPTAFYLHILSSPISLALAVFLMLSGARSRHRLRHRWAGRIQFFLVLLLVAPSGMVMAYYAYGGPIAGWGFASLNLTLVISLVIAVSRARAGRFAAHRQWATRCFLLLASPLLLRLITGGTIVMGIDSAETYRLNAWGSWLAPLLCYQVYLTRNSRPEPLFSAQAECLAYDESMSPPSQEHSE